LNFFFKLLGIAQQEKNGILEKLSFSKDEIGKLNLELNKLKRESNLKQEQDKSNMIGLQDEIKGIRNQ
jgi:hypothetical protein